MTALNKETSQTGIPPAAIGKQSRAGKCAEVDAKGKKKILAQDLLSCMSFKSMERCKVLVTVRHEKVKKAELAASDGPVAHFIFNTL